MLLQVILEASVNTREGEGGGGRGRQGKARQGEAFNCHLRYKHILPLYLVDLLESKHALAEYAPGLVGVHVVADYLGGQHKNTKW
jgi:hypothetical protein